MTIIKEEDKKMWKNKDRAGSVIYQPGRNTDRGWNEELVQAVYLAIVNNSLSAHCFSPILGLPKKLTFLWTIIF